MEGQKPLKQKFVWFITLYFFQALPFFLVTSVSIILFKQFRISNSVMALATSVFYLPWVLKAFGGPIVQAKSDLRKWIYFSQVGLGVLVIAESFFTGLPSFISIASVFFTLIAVLAVFHDIAAEGMYLGALDAFEQRWFVGFRACFFRLGWVFTQGFLIAWIGKMESSGLPLPEIWRIALSSTGGFFILFGIYHFFTLPNPDTQTSIPYVPVFLAFFKREKVWLIVSYLLIFRIGEAQLQKLAMPFLLDPVGKGGLALSTQTVGILYGSLGPASLTLGGLLGGWLVAKHGLKRWFVPMTISLNLPHLTYLLLALFPTQNLVWVGVAVNVEQFFYGFAFTAYLLFLVETCRTGKYPTASYALGTGIMSLGMMLPGAWSGKLQEWLGYRDFFWWVLACSIPSIWVTLKASTVLEEIPE